MKELSFEEIERRRIRRNEIRMKCYYKKKQERLEKANKLAEEKIKNLKGDSSMNEVEKNISYIREDMKQYNVFPSGFIASSSFPSVQVFQIGQDNDLCKNYIFNNTSDRNEFIEQIARIIIGNLKGEK